MELHFRPEDPYSHPAFGELRPCQKFILKISSEKLHNGHDAKASDSLLNNETQTEVQTTQSKSDTASIDGESNLIADIVANVPEAYCFNG